LYREKTLKELGDKICFQGDIEYVKVESVSLKLDLYLPAKIDPANKPPLVVWFHGGGWRGGSKDHCIMAWLATENFAVASVEFRSVLQWPFPNNIHDCKAAIRWLRANADKYDYDARRIGTSGASAGGHLAAIIGTSAEVKFLEGKIGDHLDQSSRVQAVIDMAGVASIPDWATTPRGLSLILGIPFSENNGVAALGELFSADTHVTSDDPPILIMHGDNDKVVPLKQSQDFYESCKRARLDATLEIIPRGGHAGAPFVDAKHKAMIKSFFDKHLRQP
jgi:acetyl esterase/lipase